MSTQAIITTYILPVFTLTLVNWMFYAPVKTLREQNKVGTLGFLNPTPWVFMFGNCFAWVTYSLVMERGLDYKITMLLANGPGLLLSIWLNLCACKLQYQDYMSGKMKEEFVKFLFEQKESGNMISSSGSSSQFVKSPNIAHLVPLINNITVKEAVAPNNHERNVVLMASFWFVVVCLLIFLPIDAEQRTWIVGIIGNILLVFFYAAPLSTIFIVIKTRSSATIHVRTMLLNTANSSFWFVYTIFQNDPMQYVPNGIGAVLGYIQIILSCVFPRKFDEEDDFEDQSEIFDEEEIVSMQERDRKNSDEFDEDELIKSYKTGSTTATQRQSSSKRHHNNHSSHHNTKSSRHYGPGKAQYNHFVDKIDLKRTGSF